MGEVDIKAFAEPRGADVKTIHKYLNRHKEEFEGHTRRLGKTTLLDETAIELLDKVYKHPKPVQVVQDDEAREENAKLRERVIMLYEKNNELLEENGRLKEAAAMLEVRDARIAALEDKSQRDEAERERLKQESEAALERQRQETDTVRGELKEEQAARTVAETALATKTEQLEALMGMGFFARRRYIKELKKKQAEEKTE